MTPGPEANRVPLAHMRDRLDRIVEYTHSDQLRFESSRLVQHAVIRNLQTLTESSQRLSDEIKATEAHIPWRELAGFRNVIVHNHTNESDPAPLSLLGLGLLAASLTPLEGKIPPRASWPFASAIGLSVKPSTERNAAGAGIGIGHASCFPPAWTCRFARALRLITYRDRGST